MQAVWRRIFGAVRLYGVIRETHSGAESALDSERSEQRAPREMPPRVRRQLEDHIGAWEWMEGSSRPGRGAGSRSLDHSLTSFGVA